MSSPSDEASSIWPPPPASAPETFTVEGFTVTKNVDQLLIQNSSRGWLIGPISYAFTLLAQLTWMIWHAYKHQRTLFGPGQHSWPYFLDWAYLSFAHYLIFWILLGTLCLAFVTGFSYSVYLRAGQGITSFSRLTNAVAEGKRMATVVSVSLPYLLRDSPPYIITCDLDQRQKSGFGDRPPKFAFQQRENAERMGKIIAEFLDVPVRWV